MIILMLFFCDAGIYTCAFIILDGHNIAIISHTLCPRKSFILIGGGVSNYIFGGDSLRCDVFIVEGNSMAFFCQGKHSIQKIVPGIVTNITKFGCFVDIGVHQDGLVHVSQLANRYVRDANEVVKLHQHVEVRVVEVDLQRRRISLSMRK